MRYQCSSCETTLKEVTAFCPKCGRPTRYATPDEVTTFELGQWRKHAEANETPQNGTSGAVPAGVHTAAPAPSAAITRDVERPKRAAKRSRHRPGRTKSPSRSVAARVTAKKEETGRDRSPAKLRSRKPTPAVAAPSDDPFRYTACTSCDRTDWVIRTGRNEDDSWRYWCVRCSRSFKTDARIPHGVKPFATAGSILVTLAVLANVL